jgi:hypothetical protein
MNNSDYLAKVKRPPPPQLAFGINFRPRIHLSFLLFSYFLHDPSQFGGFLTTCENSVKEKKVEITRQCKFIADLAKYEEMRSVYAKLYSKDDNCLVKTYCS